MFTHSMLTALYRIAYAIGSDVSLHSDKTTTLSFHYNTPSASHDSRGVASSPMYEMTYFAQDLAAHPKIRRGANASVTVREILIADMARFLRIPSFEICTAYSCIFLTRFLPKEAM